MSIIGTSTGRLRDLGVARVLDAQLAVLDHRDVGGGAADVDGDDVVLAAILAGPAAADDAAGRAGQQQADRQLGRVLDGRDAAIRLHDAHHRVDAARRGAALFEALQIGRRLGPI